jgi:hypothetical protein
MKVVGDWGGWLWDSKEVGCGRRERIDVEEGGRESLWEGDEDGCERRARIVKGSLSRDFRLQVFS